jgi:putative SOS response-associated peptidase YedK
MCYHYGLAKDKATLENRYKAKAAQTLKIPFTRVGAFEPAARQLPVIKNTAADSIAAMHWGLIPSWSHSGTIEAATYNAMVETAHQKPTFRQAWGRQHCLIPADGFYEWQHIGSKKLPHFIFLPEAPIFSFAGLWDRWTDPASGQFIESFTILTGPANALMAEIHNTKKRMPLIVPEDLEKAWLEADSKIATQLLSNFYAPNLAAQRAHPHLLKLGNTLAMRQFPGV